MKKILLCNKTNKKIEPHILSPCLSNKDSLAKDRVPAQVFEKSTDHMANKKKGEMNCQWAPECKKKYDKSSVQNISCLVLFCFLGIRC